MSKHTDENCILFEEDAHEAIEFWLSDDKKIEIKPVKEKRKDVYLDPFGPTPMRKIIVK